MTTLMSLVEHPVESIAFYYIRLYLSNQESGSKRFAQKLSADFPIRFAISHERELAIAGSHLAFGVILLQSDDSSPNINERLIKAAEFARLVFAECKGNRDFGLDAFLLALENYLLCFALLREYLNGKKSMISEFQVRSSIVDLLSILSVLNAKQFSDFVKVTNQKNTVSEVITDLDTTDADSLGRSLPYFEDSRQQKLVGLVAQIWGAKPWEIFKLYLELINVLPKEPKFWLSSLDEEPTYALVAQPLANREDVRAGLATLRSSLVKKVL